MFTLEDTLLRKMQFWSFSLEKIWQADDMTRLCIESKGKFFLAVPPSVSLPLVVHRSGITSAPGALPESLYLFQ